MRAISSEKQSYSYQWTFIRPVACHAFEVIPCLFLVRMCNKAKMAFLLRCAFNFCSNYNFFNKIVSKIKVSRTLHEVTRVCVDFKLFIISMQNCSFSLVILLWRPWGLHSKSVFCFLENPCMTFPRTGSIDGEVWKIRRTGPSDRRRSSDSPRFAL